MVMRAMSGLVLIGLLSACGSGSEVEEWAPANARALAAVVLDHTDERSWITFEEFRYVTEDADGIRMMMEFEADDQEPSPDFTIHVEARENDPDLDRCHYGGGCAIITRDDTEIALSWWDENLDNDPGGFAVVRQSDDAYLRLTYAGVALSSDPREADLEEYFDLFSDIAVDPRFDLETDERLTTADVPGFPDPEPEEQPEQTAPITPQALIADLALMLDDAETAYEVVLGEEYGDSVAARLESERRDFTMILLTDPPPDAVPECPDGWECNSDDGAPEYVYAWTSGVHMVTHLAPDGYVAIVIAEDPGPLGERPNAAGMPVLERTQAELIAPEVPRSEVVRGESVDLWDEGRVDGDWDLHDVIDR